MEKKATLLNLPQEVKSKMKSQAKKKGVSMSHYVRLLVENDKD